MHVVDIMDVCFAGEDHRHGAVASKAIPWALGVGIIYTSKTIGEHFRRL